VTDVSPRSDAADDALAGGAATADAAATDDATAGDVPDGDAVADATTNGHVPSVRVGDVKLTGDRLVVRPPGSGERKTNSGLLIPATAAPAPKRLSWADVALVGPDVRVAKVGDRVLFLPQSGLEVELDGEELVLLRERDVQAVSAPTSPNAERVPGQYL
jgi:chaperonin GroES